MQPLKSDILLIHLMRSKEFLFVCLLGVFHPTGEFFTHMRCHYCRWRATNFDLCLALMAIEQWGFFSVPHLLEHGASICNGHLRGPVTLTPIAECIPEELALPVFTTSGLSWLGFEHPTFHMRGHRSNPLCHRHGDQKNYWRSLFFANYKYQESKYVRFQEQNPK